ncbi:MAG: GGDEF domain-containing protein [Acidobacteriota bacterium]|nr:GGDEF domain-containing protein [Acidobacteriota bacterium]
MSEIGHETPISAAERPVDPALLGRLARCLDLLELEEALLEVLIERCPHATALVSLSGTTDEPSRVRDLDGIRAWRSGDLVPPVLVAPVVDRGETMGWIGYLDDGTSGWFGPSAHGHLLEVSAAAAIPARNARLHAAAVELSLKDPLTGLFNRRAFSTFLTREAESARRYDRPLALILADLDRFKPINDTYGHPVGDEALRLTARVLSTEARKSDIVARLGGDEFAVLLPASDATNALQLGKRILERMSSVQFSPAGIGSLIGVEASLGTADLKLAGGDADTLIEMADSALLSAKRAGGHRIDRYCDGLTGELDASSAAAGIEEIR